jgi:hypothetical protein
MEFGVGWSTTEVSDDVLRALGQVVVNFGLRDLHLSNVTAELVGGEVAVGRAIYAPLSMPQRVALLSALTKIRAPLFPVDDVTTLCSRINQASDRRNDAVHSVIIAVGPAKEPWRVKERTREKKGYYATAEPIDLAALKADAEFISQVASDVVRAGSFIVEQLGKAPPGVEGAS